jgi:hypothetical protein
METQTQNEQFQREPHVPHWSPASRIAFRFCFVYLGLFCIANTLGGLYPFLRVDDTVGLGTLWPLREITFWTAAHIFGAKLPLVYRGSGSDDKIFDWVMTFCLLVFAVLATGIWSALDRKRENYITVHKWFRLFIRFELASVLLYFGICKVIPIQMPFPYLTTLLAPFGRFLPMGILWSSVGASPAYEIFAGCAEVLGAILLIVPRTTMLGALVCLADMIQVFMLNMTYDVPVKLFSFHLLLMALFLLAPEFSRLVDVFLGNRAVGPSTEAQLFRTRRANRIALTVQILVGVWLLGMNARLGVTAWSMYGNGRPKSPLYGIWSVDELSIDGQFRPPLLTDKDRWRRAVFDATDWMTFQRMDDSFASYFSSIDLNAKTLALTKQSDKSWKANFNFQRVAQEQLTLDGNMDGHKVHMQLQLVNLKNFVLANPRFHWVQEYPFTP